MPLQAPILDDRRFDDLFEEARARIPRYTPEWTNFNDSDPGITLVQLHAWLTETILFRLNQLPDKTYIKFLELLNVRQHAAVAAQAQLSFTLKKLSDPADPLVVRIPKNSQVAVDDPDLEEELIFETDRTLTALNAALAAVVVPRSSGAVGAATIELATEYDDDDRLAEIVRPFFPFGDAPATDTAMLVGLLLRPHRKKNTDYSLDAFPEGELDLTIFVPEVFEDDATGNEITGPQGIECLFPWEVAAESETIAWEVYVGQSHQTEFEENQAWQRLGTHDETAALTRSGHVTLEVPGRVSSVAFSGLSRSFWEDLGLLKPPTTADELADDIDNGDIDPEDLDDAVWLDALGFSEKPDLETLTLAELVDDIRAATLDPSTLGPDEAAVEEVWVEAGYDASPVPHELYWFRARLLAEPEEPPEVSAVLLNTVGATAAVTRTEEIVGVSDGRPNQVFTLSRSPLLVDRRTGEAELTLDVVEPVGEDEDQTWAAVADFYFEKKDEGAEAAVFLLDPETGQITFGDGEHGRIPVAGAEIIARQYRYGGGTVGNAGPGTITNLRSVLIDVDSVTNVRAAAGGKNVEPLSETLLRAPHDLRHRERAVTGEDFADLARQTRGVHIQRAFALPLTRADLTRTPPAFVHDVPGAVTVVVLPENKEETPQPTEDQLRLVCDHLNFRRLITTELYVVGPRYLRLTRLRAEITVRRDADLKAVHDAVKAQLLAYFQPLTGGDEGRGWPFGQDIFFGHVYRQVLQVEGVQRVLCLEIEAPQNAHLHGTIHRHHENAGTGVARQTVNAVADLTSRLAGDLTAGGGLTLSSASGLTAGHVLRLRDPSDPDRTEYVTIAASNTSQIREPGLLFDHALASTELHRVILADDPADPGDRQIEGRALRGEDFVKLTSVAGLAAGDVLRIDSGSAAEYQVIRQVEPCDDVLRVDDGSLVHLPREIIDLQVRYDPSG